MLKPHTDWSRTSRNQLALLRSGSDPCQTKITSFFTVVEKINRLTDAVPEYIIQATEEQRRERHITSVSPLFNQLLMNAESNAQKFPTRRRHAAIVKKFSTSLLIYSGPLAYSFLQQNMPEALPSVRTVQKLIYNEYHPIHEGEFRFKELWYPMVHLKSFQLEKMLLGW